MGNICIVCGGERWGVKGGTVSRQLRAESDLGCNLLFGFDEWWAPPSAALEVYWVSLRVDAGHSMLKVKLKPIKILLFREKVAADDLC